MDTRHHYRQQLAAMDDALQVLGRRVAGQVATTPDILRRGDVALAAQVVENDKHINDAQSMISTHLLDIIATQQPVARDLRWLIAAMDIASELERIGDYAKGIATVILQDTPPLSVLSATSLPHLAEQAHAMLLDALDALTQQDGDIAHRLEAADDRVDALHERVRDELIALIQNDPTTATWALDGRKVAYLLERIADRATNIGEQVIFMVCGETVELNH